jgi:hypothetical protein
VNDRGSSEGDDPRYRVAGVYASYRDKTYRVGVYDTRRCITLQIGEDEVASFDDVEPGTAPKAIVPVRKLDGPPEVDPSGLYARYRGKTYRIERRPDRRLGDEAFVVLDIDDDEVDEFTDVVPRVAPTAKVSFHVLDGLIRVDLRGRFAGRDIQVMSFDECNVEFFANGPAWWTSEDGLKGSTRDGFWGTVPRAQVDSIREDIVDLLPKERHRKSKNL